MEADLEALMRTFILESEENLRALDEGFVVLEKNPDDAETIGQIFRMAHTLKGNAASLGFATLAEFAHEVEDVLDRLREKTLTLSGPLVSVLLEAVDALRELLIDGTSGREGMRPSHKAILDRLVSMTRGEPDARAEDTRAPAISLVPHEIKAQAEPVSKKRTLRVDIDRLNRLLNLTGEIAIERGRVRELMEHLGGKAAAALLERHAEADALHAELHELVMKLRMVPLGPTFRQYLRTVPDVAASVGEAARLVMEREDG